MPRQKEYPEQINFQGPEGMIASVADVLEAGESKGDFYRAAVVEKVKRRKRVSGRLPKGEDSATG